MESFRLKNIAILILLLLNVFLLLLLGFRQLQAHRSASEAETQLRGLYASHNLSLSSKIDLSSPSLSRLTLSRNTDTEAAIAAFLLGDESASSDQGGGIIQYSGSTGSILFRAGGHFDGSGLSRAVPDIDSFTGDFLARFGYGDPVGLITDGTGTVSAIQYAADVPVSGCSITLHFQDGILTQVSGAHISLQDASVDSSEPLTCISALVRFLDHRNSSGIVCSSVEDIRCVYVLQSTTSSMRLLPVWQIKTNTYDYFVDCSTGTVSRR